MHNLFISFQSYLFTYVISHDNFKYLYTYLPDTVVIFSTPGSPSPIKFVAITEIVYIVLGIKLVKLILVVLYIVTAAGHGDFPVHDMV